MSEHRQLLKSASLITGFTFISRIFGYFRDNRIAFLLGTSPAADAFTIAFRIPNLLRRLVGEGAVSAAFIPVFSKYLAEGRKEEAWRFANTILTLLTMTLTIITVLGIVFSPALVKLFAWGFADTPGKLELASVLNRIMFPYIFFVSLAAFSMGILNSFHRFGPPAFAPVLLNISVIVSSFFAGAFTDPTIALAIGVIVGGLLQVAIQVPALLDTGWRLNFRWDVANEGVKRVGKLMLPVTFGVGIVQVNVLVDTLFASFLVDGSVAAIYMADRVMELVLGGFVIALSTAILPMLSRQAAERKIEDMKSTLNLATRIILFITVPATVGLMVLRKEIIEVLFERGNFDAASTALTAWPLLFFALGLSGFSMVKIIVTAFYALHDTRTPVRIAFMAMLVNVVLNFVFFYPLQNGGPALATSMAVFFNSISLMIIFRNRHGGLGIRSIMHSLLKFGAAGAVLGLVAYTMIQWPGLYIEQPAPQKIFALFATIGVAAATYFGASYLMGSREVMELRDIFRRRGRA